MKKSISYRFQNVQGYPSGCSIKSDAEAKLEQIAREYHELRLQGLVPAEPIPARLLLWEEVSRKRELMNEQTQRGVCIFGRDTRHVCSCKQYHCELDDQGVCELCGHGASWHKIGKYSAAPSTWNTFDQIRMLELESVTYSEYDCANEIAEYIEPPVKFPSVGFDKAFNVHASEPNKLQATIVAMHEMHDMGLSDDEIERRLQHDIISQGSVPHF